MSRIESLLNLLHWNGFENEIDLIIKNNPFQLGKMWKVKNPHHVINLFYDYKTGIIENSFFKISKNEDTSLISVPTKLQVSNFINYNLEEISKYIIQDIENNFIFKKKAIDESYFSAEEYQSFKSTVPYFKNVNDQFNYLIETRKEFNKRFRK